MSAPFRDLFVELPRALFETLQAIACEAVVRAERTTSEPRRPQWWSDRGVTAALRQRYGFSRMAITRSSLRDELEITGLSACGHLCKATLTEREAILLDHSEVLDAIDRAIDKAKTCLCVERPS